MKSLHYMNVMIPRCVIFGLEVVLKRNGRDFVPAEERQNEAAEESEDDLRHQNGRQSLVNIWCDLCIRQKWKIQFPWCTGVSLLQLPVHTEQEDIPWPML